jgi:ribonuclease HII
MTWPKETGDLGVAAWKRLLDERGGNAPAPVREALAADPRAGARALAKSLETKRRARRRENDRLRRLLSFERELWDRGVELVAGVDEAGMGPLAGPVVAAAAILSPGQRFEGLDDSKRLDRQERERLAARVKAEVVAWSVGSASVADIAERDIYQAGLLAMRRAVEGLKPQPQHLLVDARTVPEVGIPQDGHVKGDARSLSIAAASVIAKTERDAWMARLDTEHPGYGFARHHGYGTPDHLEALRELGPCPEHRTSWQAVAEYCGEWSAAFYRLRDALEAVSDAAALDRWRRDSGRAAGELEPEELRRLEQLASRRGAKVERAPRAESGALPFD